MEKKLYDACLEGDVEMLEALIREDKLTLARVSISSCFNQTPLHLASMLGHFEFAKSLLSYKPDFASRLDSQGRSPLHLASANGYANIVKLLLQHDQKMCLVCDEDGRTPLHLAVMNGQHESVSELIKVNSESRDQGLGTVLHLAVMFNRLNVLILMLDFNGQDLLNIKDDQGNTILHSATTLTRMQIIKYLLVMSRREALDVNAVNENGLTALDLIEQMPKDVKTMEIKELLISAGTVRANEIKGATTISQVSGVHNIEGATSAAAGDNNSKRVKILKKSKSSSIFPKKQEKGDKNLLVAASVIAAMAYQAAISPPGGVAAVDATENLAPYPSYKAYGVEPETALLAYFHPTLSDLFWISNTISYMAALSVIFLFVSGASPKRRFFIWLLRLGMWITLSSMTFAYVFAVLAITPSNRTISMVGIDWPVHQPAVAALIIGLVAWLGLIGLSILVIVYRILSYILRRSIMIIVMIIKRATGYKKKNTSTEEAAATFRTPNTNIV